MSEDIDLSNLNYTGWINDPMAVEEIKSEFGILNVNQCVGAIPYSDRPKMISLLPYLEKAYGKQFFKSQLSCGSCCGFATSHAVDVLMAIDHIENGAELPKQSDPMTIYWNSRVAVGKNRLGRGQGSVGAWCAQSVQQFGVLEQKRYDSFDLSHYDPNVCCGSHATSGVPSGLSQTAGQHCVKHYAQVSNFNDMTDAIASGYPVIVCSNQGFTQQRDEDGFARPHGSWAHAMCILGVRTDDRPGAMILNSWGSYFSGGGDLCRACFWADRATVDRMLRQDDSWTISDLEGWPRKKLDLSVLNW